jgi:microsomal dipeptidase-like Zn-dependent dipeptidase/gamma-glutamyl-gamma-aminobutyrate hydrolase PuuD
MKRPVIGITGNYADQTCTLAEGYYQSVLKAGGIPVIIPPRYVEEGDDCSDLTGVLDNIDGIVFSGGGDPNPLLFGEEPVVQLHSITPERDLQELKLVRMAYDRQIPMLGICKGIQMINAALGGTLYQDIHSQKEGGVWVKHSQDEDRRFPSHTVKVENGTLLHKLFGRDTLQVNSFHHQACKDIAPCLRLSAISPDGIIEAIESNEYKSILGVQWHPETFVLRDSDEMMPIFHWLIGEAQEFKAARELHTKIVTLDSHCDSPMILAPQQVDWAEAFSRRNPDLLVDLQKMDEGHLDGTIMVAYLAQGARDEEGLKAATAKANDILSKMENMAARCADRVAIARCPDDLRRLKLEGRHGIMLGIENGYAIGKDIKNIEIFRNRGVVYMTLCHNGDNDICDSAKGNNEHGGVSQFGADVIREMNRVGMMVDLSHGGEKSFYDALDISAQPIVCSHSSARVLCDHPRNLTDDQMRALAQKGGVAQVTFYHGFLKSEGEASIIDAIAHLNHMVKIMGVEHVGIGTDFDGDGGVKGIASASELINFTRRLLRERYTNEEIQMLWGGNFLRVMQQVQQAAGN